MYLEYNIGPTTEPCGTFVLNINKLAPVQKIGLKPSESLALDSQAMIKLIQ